MCCDNVNRVASDPRWRLKAVQGANWAQYWLSQIAIAMLIAFLYAAGLRWRAHAAEASRPGRRGPIGTAPRAWLRERA
jgi:hypothetical protein